MLARLRAQNGSIHMRQGSMAHGATINMSCIPGDESQAFMSRNEQNELFGSVMKPDIVKI